MENLTFRLRPCNENTFDELRNHYLWFSKPNYLLFPECNKYKDLDDCNVSAVVEQNESINEALERIFEEKDELLEKSKHIGICCFTKEFPDKKIWNKFPNGNCSILIEYDKKNISDYFIDKYGFYACFQSVEYLNNPLKFKTYSGYEISWNITKDGEYYKPLEYVFLDPKLFDELFRKIFTRINKKHIIQNEARIILSGGIINLIGGYDYSSKGYKIEIPKEAIKKVYISNKLINNSICSLITKIGIPFEIV